MEVRADCLECSPSAMLAQRLESLEHSVAAPESDTRKKFDQVYEAIFG
jgi:hypothetical protein